MIGQYGRRIGSRFDRGTRTAPRFFLRGYRRPSFFYAHPGYRRWSGQQPTKEQQALRSTAAEVARLFVLAARSAYGNAEKQRQLQAFLERSRTELSEFVKGSSEQPQQASTENAPQVEQA